MGNPEDGVGTIVREIVDCRMRLGNGSGVGIAGYGSSGHVERGAGGGGGFRLFGRWYGRCEDKQWGWG